MPPPLSSACSDDAFLVTEWGSLLDKLRLASLDVDGWTRLTEMALCSGDAERVTQAYDGFLELFPNTVRVSLIICRAELMRSLGHGADCVC